MCVGRVWLVGGCSGIVALTRMEMHACTVPVMLLAELTY